MWYSCKLIVIIVGEAHEPPVLFGKNHCGRMWASAPTVRDDRTAIFANKKQLPLLREAVKSVYSIFPYILWISSLKPLPSSASIIRSGITVRLLPPFFLPSTSTSHGWGLFLL